MLGQFLPSPFRIMPKYSKEVLAWEVVVHPELALTRRLLVFVPKLYKVPSLEVILAFHLANTITLCGFDMGRWYVLYIIGFGLL